MNVNEREELIKESGGLKKIPGSINQKKQDKLMIEAIDLYTFIFYFMFSV